ncbi:MAG: peptidoglycan-binding protein [Paracoccaceae bacterium]
MLKRFITGLTVIVLSIGTTPTNLINLNFAPSEAFARAGGQGGFSRGGGGHARPSGGARTRPSHHGARPSTRPSTRPSAKPSTRPAAPRPKPSPGVSRPKPAPAVTRPSPGKSRPDHGVSRPDHRPPGARPPGSRPPGARPPGGRPPGSRPPTARPPHHRPPGYHPPHHRPPGYRPPYYPPPYYRPPNPYWGDYYYSDSWGWFFTAALVGSTLVFVSDLSDDDCEKVQEDGETLYLCDGVLYRSTNYEDERVYEIVSDDPNEKAPSEPQTPFGLAVTDPLTQGGIVRDVQQRLNDAGYDVGGIDGVYGTGTESAVMWLQYDNGLDATGVIDEKTAELLGYGDGPSKGDSEESSGDDAALENTTDGAAGEDTGDVTDEAPSEDASEADDGDTTAPAASD